MLDKTIEYVYNGIGNIESVKTYDYTPKGTEPSGTPVTKSFTYSTSRPDRLTRYNGAIVTYSSMGCPTTFNGMSATWTRGKLSSITKGTIRTDRYNYAFQYNALGQRIEKSYTRVPPLNGISSLQAGDVTNYTKQYVYDHSGRLIQEATNGTKHEVGAYSETLKYLYDESGMIGFTYELNDEDDEAYYYQRNLLGDVIAIYNTSGNKVVEYAYDAWGNCTIKGTTTNYVIAYANPIRYRGYYYDEDTNLYYLNARYYSPEFRRFISPDDTNYLDPESVNGLNLYCYCNNDPINFVDPSGHSIIAILIGGFIVGAVAGGTISLTTQLIENDFNIDEVNPWLVVSDAIFGGVNGLLAVSGASTLASALLSATVSNLQLIATSAISGEDISNFDILIATVLGFAGAFIPKTGINSKQVSGKMATFAWHLNNAVGSKRRLMYTIKRSELIKDVVISGVNYVASTIGISVISDYLNKNKERYYYGY